MITNREQARTVAQTITKSGDWRALGTGGVVRSSDPESVAGRRARERLRVIANIMRKLAADTGDRAIIDAVESVVAPDL